MNNENLLKDYTTDFFVLRSPLLPIHVLLQLNKSLEENGVNVFQQELLQIFENKLLHDAIYLASPVLYTELLKITDQTNDRNKILDSLYQYLIRMTTRSTPFGLFAGTNMGSVGADETKLIIHNANTIEKHLRLDMNYLAALAHQLAIEKEPKSFSYHANTSIYKIGHKLRFTETRFFKDNRSYQITNIDHNALLALLLPFLATNKPYAEIIAFVCELGIPEVNAISYVNELISSQILINNLAANVTGIDYMDKLVNELDCAATLSEYHLLAQAVNAIKTDRTKGIALFQAVKSILSSLPAPIDESKLFQMDISKNALICNLNQTIVEDVKDCVQVLSKLIYDTSNYGNFAKFKAAFEERYETNLVKLTDVLDAEIGIDYQNIVSNAHIGQPDYNPGTNAIFGYKLSKFQQAIKNGQLSVTIQDQDFGFINSQIKLPNSIGLMIKLHQSEKSNETQLEFKYAAGPSAANLLGRFCQSNPLMDKKVQEQLRLEELHHPDKIYAEIVHLPQARVGNVLARPHLRQYEIVFLAQSSLASEYLITLDDLYLKMEYGKLILFSKRLKKEIIPRLSNAHNYANNSNLQCYQFLCDLQKQNQTTAIGWSWDFLSNQPFLPRVLYKNHILSPALWNIPIKRLSFLNTGPEQEQQQQLTSLFNELQLPKHVFFIEGDNELLLNTDHAFTFRTIKKAFKKNKSIQFKEVISINEKPLLLDENKQGYTHEIFIPLTKNLPQNQQDLIKQKVSSPSRFKRNFAIGSEWAYFQIYTGVTTADRILRLPLIKLLTKLFKRGIIDKWFFIRYSDPKFHLRVRIHLTDTSHFSTVMNQIHQTLNPLIVSGEISDFAMRTYKREVERYGQQNMLLSETVFFINSNCVTQLIQIIHQLNIPEQKLSIILCAIDQYLKDFELNPQETLHFLQVNRNAFAREFRLEQSKELKLQIQNNYRNSKVHLEKILSEQLNDEIPMKGFNEIKAIIKQQTLALKPITPFINKALKNNREIYLQVIASYVHMYVNRFYPSNARFQEFIVYEFLERYQLSKLARQKKLS